MIIFQFNRDGLSKKLVNITLFFRVFKYNHSSGNTKNTEICTATSMTFSEAPAKDSGSTITTIPKIIHAKKFRSRIRENAY
ncbi:hypothetical protein EMIT079MI2_60096 [Bacillus sp. IT-79MI2]